MRVRHLATAAAAAAAGAAAFLFVFPFLPGVFAEEPAPAAAAAAGAKPVVIDLDRAVAIPVGKIEADLKPHPFKTPDGKEGWVVRIPGGRPIATPAYADGLLFVGGGYGSHEFYAFDARSGEVVWRMKTADDGPTAAVVAEGCVAFNTESCTVIVAEAKTGKVIWQKWLGDPLMSQPAIAGGRIYIAYPDSRGDGKHRLLCADLRTGRRLWATEITADVISAPVVENGQVFLTCFDGTSFRIDAADGKVVWKKKNAGTSAPLIAAGQLILSLKGVRGGRLEEGLKRLDLAGGEKDRELLAAGRASYLRAGAGGGVALGGAAGALDAEVGFADAPSSAKLGQANEHLGVSTVAGGWAYQGARPVVSGGRMMNAQGLALNCFRAGDARRLWRAEARGTGLDESAQLFSPPAAGARNLYLVSARGHLLSVRQRDGAVRFLYATGQPMVFQPALAKGNVYAGTANGLLYCLKTGDEDADGWYAWGGNARHNQSR